MELIAEEYLRGQQQSAADFAASCPKLHWQTRGTWGELLTQLLADRFAITVVHASDITSRAEISFREGYNRTTAAQIDKDFGAGSFQSVLDEVAQKRQTQYRRYLESQDSSHD